MIRDLAKTATFAALHFAVGFGVSYAFTGSVAIATGIALVEPAVNTIFFFFHERAWRRRSFRSVKAAMIHDAVATPATRS
jgi:uncharacterized membrane protein